MPYTSIVETKIKGVYLIQPKLFGDERGWYLPELEVSELEAAIGMQFRITQIASSFNIKPGILRGLHYQKPNTQGKLVQAVSGSVLDVAVDVRHGSPTFGQYVSAKLTASEHNQLWVPPGMAHGYLALEANTQFSYVVTNGVYDTSAEKGINPFDPELNIDWGMDRALMDLKDRDLNLPNLKDIPIENLL
ncbi:dTDP-4-dehydrorhamnose 3,5-epimerase [Candidatus Shapirobacteria bacterium]|nr:dTDP-4-dehydrorhamnose 3,5-epimerase [Candidatus Shapirobacteria bacterium]